MTKPIKRIAVTGGAGQIAYSLLFRIAHGDMLRYDQPIALHILEVPEVMKSLEGVRMELEDCAFPLLHELVIGSNPEEIFEDVDYAILVGAKPRGPGMERADLLNDNAKIFIAQGKALNAAKPNATVLVVGNPCNTNCLIAMTHATKLPVKNFHAMTRLDQNRATAQLAIKAGVTSNEISQMAIWGNHSATQVPDFVNARISNRPLFEVIEDRSWLEKEFVSTVQKRGAAIIAARGKSSAASAASAIIDAVKSLTQRTAANDWFSSAVYTKNNPYGIDDHLIFSFPCRSNGSGDCEIIPNVLWDKYLEEKIRISEKELIEERDFVKNLLGKR